MRKEIPILRGIFSRKSLPSSWKTAHNQDEIDMLRQVVQHSTSSAEIIGEIPRSSNSITLLLKNSNKLLVAQLSSAKTVKEVDTENWERQNPNKFRSISFVNEIAHAGVNIPKILDFGTIDDRSFVVMEFIRGVSADRFIDTWPEKAPQVFFSAGVQFGKLASVNIPVALQEKSKMSLPNKMAPFLDFLTTHNTITEREKAEVERSLLTRLKILNNHVTTLVHLDPFPVNWHITGSRKEFKLSLLDLEAVGVGHPYIEGIGRALQWATEDWFWIKNTPNLVGKFLTNLVQGYNSSVVDTLKISPDPDKLAMLKDTAELAWLPQAIVYEMTKERPSELPRRRKKNLLKLANKL